MAKYSLVYILARKKYFAEGDCGRVTHALGVAEGFAENGWSVEILSGPNLKSYQELLPDSVSLTEINPIKSGDFRWILHLFAEFKKLILKKNINAFIVRYAVKKFLLCWLMCAVARKKRVVCVVEVNSFAFHHNVFQRFPVFNSILKKAEIFIASRFDIIYSVSDSLTRTILEIAPKANVVTIPNASSSATVKFSNNRTRNVIDSKFRFVYLGSLHSYYDFELLLTAFKQLPMDFRECELHFFGSGMMLNKLVKVAYMHSNIVFHGIYKREDIGNLLNNQKDILVLPPNIQARMEISGGLSTKLFEYLSLGIPIIAPAAKETNDILTDKVNAILYDHTRIDSLIEAFILILSNTPLRKKIAANAYRDFLNNHTWCARMRILAQAIHDTKPINGKDQIGDK